MSLVEKDGGTCKNGLEIQDLSPARDVPKYKLLGHAYGH